MTFVLVFDSVFSVREHWWAVLVSNKMVFERACGSEAAFFSECPSVCVSVCPSVRLSLCLSVSLSVCLSV